MSCESEPLPVSSSFLDDNSFMVETFSEIGSVLTTQDDSVSTGDSYRLYTGDIHGQSSIAYLKVNTNLIRSSKYCNIIPDIYEQNSIESVDTIKLVLRAFTPLQDSDDSTRFLIDKENLRIRGGFANIYSWEGDSSIIFEDNISTDLEDLNLIDSDLIDYDEYTIFVTLPIDDSTLLTNEWCEHDCFLGDYYISIEYNPSSNDYEQYIEFLSSQNYYQSSTIFRPSLRFIYNEFEDSIAYSDKWFLDELSGASASFYNILTEEDEQKDIYYVHNDLIDTKSKILLINNIDEIFNNNIYNEAETYIGDINIGIDEESLFSDGKYTLELNFEFNEDILDSISMVDFFIDSIKIISEDIDPSDDNFLDGGEGFEGNGVWDFVDEDENDIFDEGEECEDFIDLGSDNCPDIYEDPSKDSGCLCDNYISNSDLCEDDNLIYNSSGTELNGNHDSGEEFPSEYDCGEDGLCDLEESEYDSESNTDPSNDNYNIDPNNDNWHDYGNDGCRDEFETGNINNPCDLNQSSNCLDDDLYGENCLSDPNNDNWGYGNVENGTEGNDRWDQGEGLEGNGRYELGESFSDWGTDGVPLDQEENCPYCSDDANSEGNDVWDYVDENQNGEYDIGESCETFQDTGIDGFYTVYEVGYNPYGTEGNNSRDFGEEFPSEYDCGEDGLCDIDEDEYNEISNPDPSNDNYNIDPNGDNWKDCGTDTDCVEGEEGNGGYDEGESFSDFGVDNLSDILENLSSDFSLSYYIPQTISYNILSNVELDLGPQNEVDSSKNIIFDIKSINYNEESSLTTLVIDLTADINFRAIEFRLNHSPYIQETFNKVHSKDIIHRVDQNELFEDISIYDKDDSYIVSSSDNLTLDYLNGVKFSFKFLGLEDWINNNSNISVNYNYTTLAFYINHEDPNYNFFNGSANIWLSMEGSNNRLLGVVDVVPVNSSSQIGPLLASGEKEVLIPFGTIIDEIISGDLDLNQDLTFMLDGGWNNTSRIVFHGLDSDNQYGPRLEIFYTK